MDELAQHIIDQGGWLGVALVVVGWYALRALRKDEAVSEQRATEIDELRAENSELKVRVARLETELDHLKE